MSWKFRILNSLIFFSLLGLNAQARVDNPVGFIGEKILGSTSGAPLSTNSNGQLSSGIPFTLLSTATSATTTSTTDVLMTGMTTTPAAGTYDVVFSCTARVSAAGITITISIYNGGTLTTHTVRDAIPWSSAALSTTQDEVMETHSIETVNGSQAIELRWKTSSGTATCANGHSMKVVRLQ